MRENAWKWIGEGAQDNEYYTEVDHRREMDGHIVERKIVAGDGGENKVIINLEDKP